MDLLLARWQQATWMLLLLGLLLLINALRSHKKRVLLLGDSITEQAARPGGFQILLSQLLGDGWARRHELVNKGVGGNKVGDLMLRLQPDVIAMRPALTVINIGLNDVWHRYHPTALGTPIHTFVAQYQEMIELLLKAQRPVLLCTTTRPDPGAWTEEMMAELDELNGCIAQMASEHHLPLVDLYTAFFHAQQATEEAAGLALTTDGVHLNAAGNQLVAQALFPYVQKLGA